MENKHQAQGEELGEQTSVEEELRKRDANLRLTAEVAAKFMRRGRGG